MTLLHISRRLHNNSRAGKTEPDLVSTNHPTVARPQYSISEPAGEEAIKTALAIAPRGAFVLAALLLGMMLAGWLAFYFLLFLPRGTVR
jgi:hypothetical protein